MIVTNFWVGADRTELGICFLSLIFSKDEVSLCTFAMKVLLLSRIGSS